MIKHLDVVFADGELAETAWNIYCAAFADLQTLAVQQHLMTREEFDQILADPRIDKLLIFGPEGDFVGLGAVTTDLTAVSLLSAAWFQEHHPAEYAASRIWYVVFLAVPEHNPGAFTELVTEVYQSAAGGLVGLDVCRYNDEVLQLARRIGRLVSRHSGGRSSYAEVCRQTYWLYDLRAVTS
jgi:hypothetical protein